MADKDTNEVRQDLRSDHDDCEVPGRAPVAEPADPGQRKKKRKEKKGNARNPAFGAELGVGTRVQFPGAVKNGASED